MLSFPKTDFWFLAWIALVPLMLALDGKSLKASFGLGYLAGLVFFGTMLYWLVFVTGLGMTLMVMFLALFFGFFGIGYFWFSKKNATQRIFLLSALWVVLEFCRSHFLTGFGGGLLGHSQQKNLLFLQVADIVGVYGISFLVVMVNVWAKEIVSAWQKKDSAAFQKLALSTIIIFLLIVDVGIYGFYRLKSVDNVQASKVRISVIQANIANERRWHPSGWSLILKDHLFLAARASMDNPDLIIWPESSYPGYYWEKPELFEKLREDIKRLQIPSLVGLVTYEQGKYFNTALLFSDSGEVKDRYDKITLVPFGEYIPMRHVFPFLSHIVPIDDFTKGEKYTLFPIKTKQGKEFLFSTLICFEDAIPEVAREFAKRGTNLLVNITNDDWFQDTKAPFLHLQSAVFRAVENRRPLVRSANTGVSAFVDSAGRVFSVLSDKNKKNTYIKGFLTQEVYLVNQNTFYTKFGDVFTYLCFGSILGSVVFYFYRKLQKKKV